MLQVLEAPLAHHSLRTCSEEMIVGCSYGVDRAEVVPQGQFESLINPNFKGGIFSGSDQAISNKSQGPNRIKMRPECSLMVKSVIFEHDDGVVAADVGLVENEGLLFR